MDIGREIRTITVEPVRESAPHEAPAPSPVRTPEPLPT